MSARHTYLTFVRNIESCGPFSPHSTIAIACSGGVDSISLLLMAHKWGQLNQYKIVALHVDHNLRTESAQDSDFVLQTCRTHQIDCHILHWDSANITSSNMQQKARSARYHLLQNWCAKNDTINLLIAHHKNDQAETFMLRLERGSGLRGLTCMKMLSYIHQVRIIRPLLSITKNDLQQYLTTHHQEWITDQSNYDIKYSRNYIRQFLETGINHSKINSATLSKRLYQTAKYLEIAQEQLDRIYTQYLVKYVMLYPQGFVQINKHILSDKEMTRRALSEMINLIGGKYHEPRSVSVQKLIANIDNNTEFICTLGYCKIKYQGQYIYIWKEQKNIGADVVILASQHIWDNRFICMLPAHIQNGQYIITSMHNVSVRHRQHLSIPKYIPKFVHPSLPIIQHMHRDELICPFQSTQMTVELRNLKSSAFLCHRLNFA